MMRYSSQRMMKFNFSFKTKNLNEESAKGENLKACPKKLGETTEFDSVFHEFSEFPTFAV